MMCNTCLYKIENRELLEFYGETGVYCLYVSRFYCYTWFSTFLAIEPISSRYRQKGWPPFPFRNGAYLPRRSPMFTTIWKSMKSTRSTAAPVKFLFIEEHMPPTKNPWFHVVFPLIHLSKLRDYLCFYRVTDCRRASGPPFPRIPRIPPDRRKAFPPRDPRKFGVHLGAPSAASRDARHLPHSDWAWNGERNYLCSRTSLMNFRLRCEISLIP